MPSSSRPLVAAFFVAFAVGARAQAPRPVQGYAVDRLYRSAPGAGWLVMDALDMREGLGGAMSVTLGWARNPLVVSSGGSRLAVVGDQAVAALDAAATLHRWRFRIGLDVPVITRGHSGVLGGYTFEAPNVDMASTPDTISDVRLGVEVRIFGEATGPVRLGAGALLFTPNGSRAEYGTDDTFRGIGRLLVAGDVGRFTYAGHLGVHFRVLDEHSIPGSPWGSELLFGAAAGVRLPFPTAGALAVVIGPEVFGATPLRSLFDSSRTALEGLLTTRLEVERARLRVKLGAGGGLHQTFGAPEWRVVGGIEIVSANAR